ncbi:MAG: OmpA family protein [Myxococcales bacterium]|nr:OmpA family protein [Myxococcales bacterium]
MNDNADKGGCPDLGQEFATLDGNRLILQEPPRFTGEDVLRNGRRLRRVARIMNMSADVTLWRVVVAARPQRTDDLTRAKSQAQADAIRAALIRGKLPEARVQAVGAVSKSQVIAIAAVERGEIEEDFVCPDSMKNQERPEPEAPPAAAATAATVDRVTATKTSKELPGEMQGSQGVDRALRLKRGKAAFAGKASKRLDMLAKMLRNNPGTKLELVVHTDGNKGEAKSQEICASQAKFLVDYLVKAGIDASRIGGVGKGMSEPVADNKTSKGREKNRRVEVRFSLM